MVVVVGILGLSGCGGAPAAEAPGVLAADPWVRTTDGAEMPEMTAVFVSLTNPTKDDRVLKAAATVLARGIADLTILGDEAEVRGRAVELGLDLSAADWEPSFLCLACTPTRADDA